MVELDINDMLSKVSNAGKDIAPITFTVGFIYGATNDIAYTGGTPTGVAIQRVSDTIARIAGVQVNFGGGSTKSTQTQEFQPGNILNYGTYGAIGLEVLNSVYPTKYVRLAKNVLQPPLLGYGIGKMFDSQNGVNVGNAPSPNRNSGSAPALNASNWSA